MTPQQHRPPADGYPLEDASILLKKYGQQKAYLPEDARRARAEGFAAQIALTRMRRVLILGAVATWPPKPPIIA